MRTFLKIVKEDKKLFKSISINLLNLVRYKARVIISRKYSKLCIITLTEHIGDIVACEPVSRFIKETHPEYFVIWCVNCKYKELVQYNRHLNAIMQVTSLSEWMFFKKAAKRFALVYDLHLNERPCAKHHLIHHNENGFKITFHNYYLKGNLLQSFSKVGGLASIPDYTPEFHFNKKTKQNSLINIPNKYIVIHAQSNEIERNWDSDKWTTLIKYCINHSANITVVEIGLVSVINLTSSKYMSLCNKLNLQEIAQLIKSATLFISIESGFAHIANALNVPSIILIGKYKHFLNYMPYSGNFKNGKTASIIRYDGELKDLPVDIVEREIANRLGALFIKEYGNSLEL